MFAKYILKSQQYFSKRDGFLSICTLQVTSTVEVEITLVSGFLDAAACTALLIQPLHLISVMEHKGNER